MGGKSVAGLSSCEATVERGGGGVAAAQLLILAGGGAMGEAMRPAKEHVMLRRLPRVPAEQVGRKAEDQSSALVAERLDRVLVRRLVGGIQPEDEADGGGEPDREQHNAQRH